eukprot:364453-Chlamydomonas_euryale.AAC.1
MWGVGWPADGGGGFGGLEGVGRRLWRPADGIGGFGGFRGAGRRLGLVSLCGDDGVGPGHGMCCSAGLFSSAQLNLGLPA